MRHIRDEVAANPRHGLDFRHVARHQQLLVAGEGHELQRESAPRVAAGGDDDRGGEIAGLDVAQKFRMANEVDERLSAIVRKIEPKLRDGTRIRPVDARRGVEHHHTVRQCSGGEPEACDDVTQLALVRIARAGMTVDRGQRRHPHAAAFRHLGVERPVGPVAEALQVPQMKADDGARANGKHCTRGDGTRGSAGNRRECRHAGRRHQSPADDRLQHRLELASQAPAARGGLAAATSR